MFPVVSERHAVRIGIIEHFARPQFPGGHGNVQHNIGGAPLETQRRFIPAATADETLVLLLITEHEYATDMQRHSHAPQGPLQKITHIGDADGHFRDFSQHFFIGNAFFQKFSIVHIHSISIEVRLLYINIVIHIY